MPGYAKSSVLCVVISYSYSKVTKSLCFALSMIQRQPMCWQVVILKNYSGLTLTYIDNIAPLRLRVVICTIGDDNKYHPRCSCY